LEKIILINIKIAGAYNYPELNCFFSLEKLTEGNQKFKKIDSNISKCIVAQINLYLYYL